MTLVAKLLRRFFRGAIQNVQTIYSFGTTKTIALLPLFAALLYNHVQRLERDKCLTPSGTPML